jgi:serine protease Do
MTTALENLSAEMADVIGSVRQSLVHVHSGNGGAGAGSIWHPNGLIVTNAHVVGGGTIRVSLPDGRDLPARVVARDSGLDLAALVVEAEGLPTISLGDSRRLRPGQLVLAMGHPWGVSGAVTFGAVIGIGPHMLEKSPWEREWIVAGLRLRPGHSGGPMMDVEGRLVGINTMITGPEVAAAVPVHLVKTFLRDNLEAEKANLVA